MTNKTRTPRNAKEDLLNLIKKEVGDILSSEQWQAILKFRSKLRGYSLLNTMLIYAQMPEATAVAGYKKWLNDFGRQVKKGEKGIRILAPMIRKVRHDNGEEETRITGFRSVTVFDVSQTTGDPLPEAPTPAILTDDSPTTLTLLQRAKDHVTNLGHKITYEELPPGYLGYYSPKTNTIGLANNLPPLQQLKTLIHELAHATFGHDGTPATGDKNTKELEAETTAYLVLNHFGLDTSSYTFNYLAHYTDSLDNLTQAGEKAARAATSIATSLEEGTLPPNPRAHPQPTTPAAAAAHAAASTNPIQ